MAYENIQSYSLECHFRRCPLENAALAGGCSCGRRYSDVIVCLNCTCLSKSAVPSMISRCPAPVGRMISRADRSLLRADTHSPGCHRRAPPGGRIYKY